jgi:RNA polymerase sigma-70 factor, ECF subfamily
MAIPFPQHSMFERDLLWSLVQKAKAGNSDAFERLVRRYERLVLGLAQRLLLNRDAAKDAAQEVFLKFHRSLPALEEERDPGPWLYRTTTNVCLDAIRKRRDDLPLEAVAEPAATATDAEQTILVQQQKDIVLNALGTLTPRERAAVVLRDMEGRSTEEVADALGTTETTVRSHLSTGRTKLKQAVLAQLRRSM